MDYFDAIKGKSYSEMQKLLFDAVSSGDVRGMLNDEIVPKLHIAIYLNLYARAAPEQAPNILPPDLSLNYDDVCAVFPDFFRKAIPAEIFLGTLNRLYRHHRKGA